MTCQVWQNFSAALCFAEREPYLVSECGMETNTKRLIAAVAGTLLLVTVIAYTTMPKGLIKKADHGLLPDKQTAFELQLQVAQKSVDEITKDMSPDERATRYSVLGRAQYLLGNYQEAREAFEKTVSAKRNFPVYLEYYNLLTAMHDFEGARKLARKGLEIFPINIDLWRSLIALEKSQFSADAQKEEELLLEAFHKSEEQPDLAADLGRFYETQNNPTEALKYWKVAAEKAPQVPFYAEQVKRLEVK